MNRNRFIVLREELSTKWCHRRSLFYHISIIINNFNNKNSTYCLRVIIRTARVRVADVSAAGACAVVHNVFIYSAFICRRLVNCCQLLGRTGLAGFRKKACSAPAGPDLLQTGTLLLTYHPV